MDTPEVTFEGLLKDIADRRVCVLAASACVRLRLPRLMEIDPFNRTILEEAEAWASGQCDLAALTPTSARARNTRGGSECVAVLALANAEEALVSEHLAVLRAIPTGLWSQSAEGRAWLKADPKHLNMPFYQSVEGRRGIDAARASLVELVREIAGDALDLSVEESVLRHRAFMVRHGQDLREAGPKAPRTGVTVIPIVHAELPELPPNKSDGDPVLAESVARHLATHIGTPLRIDADTDRRWVRLDVHIVTGRGEGAPLALATCGMAERPLRYVGLDGTKIWTELVMHMPHGSPSSQAALAEPANHWPIVWLQRLGRLPHRTGVAVNEGETCGSLATPNEPLATAFGGALFLESTRLPILRMPDRAITFLAVCLLYPKELEHARAHGVASLVRALRAAGVDPEIVDATRACVC